MKRGAALPLLLGAATAATLFHLHKLSERKKVVDDVFMKAQASDDPVLVEQAVIVMRANGNEPAAQVLEVHLRALRGAA